MSTGQVIFFVYSGAWLYLVSTHVMAVSTEDLRNVVWNSVIIASFVGLGLNVNAYQMRHRIGEAHSLCRRFEYLVHNWRGVVTFFAIPFGVSSASGVVMLGEQRNVVLALFGTENYLFVMVFGFALFILIPALYILVRYGWHDRENDR